MIRMIRKLKLILLCCLFSLRSQKLWQLSIDQIRLFILYFAEALHAELRDMGVTGVNITTVHPYVVDNAMFAGATTR